MPKAAKVTLEITDIPHTFVERLTEVNLTCFAQNSDQITGITWLDPLRCPGSLANQPVRLLLFGNHQMIRPTVG